MISFLLPSAIRFISSRLDQGCPRPTSPGPELIRSDLAIWEISVSRGHDFGKLAENAIFHANVLLAAVCHAINQWPPGLVFSGL
jgi:hypothetical protein